MGLKSRLDFSPRMASSSSQATASSEAAVKGEAIVKAAEAGNINEVTKLLNKKADINYADRWINEGKEHARTPLMAAVIGGHAEVVKFLITRKANVNLAEPCGGFTALHYAVGSGNAPMIELLMIKGAKRDVRDKLGGTPLHLAANQGPKEAVACLLDHGADVNQASMKGYFPLHSAAYKGHFEIAKLLVLKGADTKKLSGTRFTPLHSAAIGGHKEIEDLLICIEYYHAEHNTVIRTCKVCGKPGSPSLQKCGCCNVVYYCRGNCWLLHWNDHKDHCERMKSEFMSFIAELEVGMSQAKSKWKEMEEEKAKKEAEEKLKLLKVN